MKAKNRNLSKFSRQICRSHKVSSIHQYSFGCSVHRATRTDLCPTRFLLVSILNRRTMALSMLEEKKKKIEIDEWKGPEKRRGVKWSRKGQATDQMSGCNGQRVVGQKVRFLPRELQTLRVPSSHRIRVVSRMLSSLYPSLCLVVSLHVQCLPWIPSICFSVCLLTSCPNMVAGRLVLLPFRRLNSSCLPLMSHVLFARVSLHGG